MNNFKFQPGDVIVYKFGKGDWGILRPFVRWLLGSPYCHVGLFFAWTKRNLPLTIESIGRGVMIRSLLASGGRQVSVMRWKGDNAEEAGLKVAKAAEHIADEPMSWYGFFDIPRFVLPRLIWYKLTKRRLGFGYRRNQFFICSELVAQAFRNAGLPLFSGDFIPLPRDLAKSPLLEEVWAGRLSAELV